VTNIAIIAESPNDSDPIAGLLARYFPDCECYPLLTNIRGGSLDGGRFPTLVRRAFLNSDPKPDILVAVRDLDALANDSHQVQLRKEFFSKLRNVINQKSKSATKASSSPRKEVPFAFLLCIYEFEALLLADLNVVNEYYNVVLDEVDAPEAQSEPKEWLKVRTQSSAKGPYQESHCPDLFPNLNIGDLCEKLPQFDKFIQRLESLM